jgi:hypothetical protein
MAMMMKQSYTIDMLIIAAAPRIVGAGSDDHSHAMPIFRELNT